MSQLEELINALNVIQSETVGAKEALKYEKTTNYLFKGKGWAILTGIYTRRIQLNEVIGEKLIDVLLHTCSQLVLNSPPEILNITNQVPSHLLFYFDEITLEQMNSTSSRKGTNESLLANKFSLLISERIKESDHLFYYIIICLDLFVRFNDGSHNCVFTVCSKTNSLYILNDFCDTLFNKSIDENQSEKSLISLIRLIYIKFLNKLLTLNFKNNNSKNQLNNSNKFLGSTSLASNILFKSQLRIITKSILVNDEQNWHRNCLNLLLKLSIEYLFNYAVSINLITFALFGSEIRQKVNGLRIAYYANINTVVFKNMVQLVNEVTEFIFSHIHQLSDDDDPKDAETQFCDDLELSAFKESSTCWRKLSECLIEMKRYKNYVEHITNCVRTKHTHQNCKLNLTELNARHNDITLLENGKCLFALMNSQMLKNLVDLPTESTNISERIKQNRIQYLISKFGICSCVKLSDLFAMQKLTKAVELGNSNLKEFYYTESLCSIISDYMIQINQNNFDLNEASHDQQEIHNKCLFAVKNILNRRSSSIFTIEYTTPSFLVDHCLKIILSLSEESVLLCKYLSGVLVKYSRSLPVSDTNIDTTISKAKQEELKWIVQESFYLFVKVVTELANINISNDNQQKKLIFELVCKFINEFLVVNNSVRVRTEISESTDTFDRFINNNSIEIFKNISKVTEEFYVKPNFVLISIGSNLIRYKHSETYSTNEIEKFLSKSLVEIVEKDYSVVLDGCLILDVLLELFIKSSSFRIEINESCQKFHVSLIECFTGYFKQIKNADLKYIELLIDFIFVYFYFNRKKDLHEIYTILKRELHINPQLLLVYFNVTILSKAFKLNKVILLNETDDPQLSFNHQESKLRTSTNNFNPPMHSLSTLSLTSCVSNHIGSFEYDADIEMSLHDSDSFVETKRYDLNGFMTHASFRSDLILFPKLLELCSTFIFENSTNRDIEQFAVQFFKRLVYLLETCNYNIHILINTGFRTTFLQFVQLCNKSLQSFSMKIMQHVFDVLYYLCLYDMQEECLNELFKVLMIEPLDSTDANLQMFQEMSSMLLLKLSENLSRMNCTNYLRMPCQISHEPIDYLLQTYSAPKKWKLNVKYEPCTPSKSNDIEVNTPVKLLSTSLKSPGFDSPPIAMLNRTINESGQNLASLHIPLNVNSAAMNGRTHEIGQSVNSHSIAFMLRFDNNLLNFSKSYGLQGSNGTNSSKQLNLDFYAHLFTIKFDSNVAKMNSCFEIWLNPTGSLLFLRRNENKILFTLNLMQINPNIWNFLYINYDETQAADSNKLNCNLSYSLNAAEIEFKEFEIELLKPSNVLHTTTKSCFYIGHDEKKKDNNYLFHYDLGQVILSKDFNYTLENLLILIHIMDTNVSHINFLNDYEWAYLNGTCHPQVIENLQQNLPEYIDQINVHMNVVYHPRNPHVYAIKPANCNSALTYVELITNVKSSSQCTLDIILAKIGGVRHLLMLIAKLVETENTIFSPKMTYYKESINRLPSLNVLDAMLNLINKRPSIQLDFNQLDGYALLQKVYTSIASLNLKENSNSNCTYYGSIQTELYSLLINSCFQKPVVCINNYIKEKIEICCLANNLPPRQSNLSDLNLLIEENEMHMINGELLSHMVIEWTLWQTFDNNPEFWNFTFDVLDTLLESNPSVQLYHSNLFIRFNIIERLMHFLLDANEDQYVLEQSSCQSFINIFKHFNSINSKSSKTKELFNSFFDYLHVLHPENKAYIAYAMNHFYYNLTICLPSVPVTSLQDYQSSGSSNELNEKQQQSPPKSQRSLKRQIINMDRFQATGNEKNFQIISASLMEIMHDMIIVLPDCLINEILNLLRYESFIMFAMDENQSKRFQAFRIFLTLIERSSTTSFLITSALVSVGTVASIAMNPSASQNAIRNFEANNSNWSANKEHLIYAMCNQLNLFDQTEYCFVECCISLLINQPFTFKKYSDELFLKTVASQIFSRVSYVTILVSLLYSTRKNSFLCLDSLKFITSLLKLELVKIDYLITKSGLLQVLFNLLRFFSQEPTEQEIMNEMKKIFSLITRLLIRYNEIQDFDNFGFYLNSMVSLCYDSSNVGYEKFNFNLKHVVLEIVQSIMSDLNSITALVPNVTATRTTKAQTTTLLKKFIRPLISPMQNSSESSENSIDKTDFVTVFDSDYKFQKFIIFLVDFIHIIYDKISDTPVINEVKSYDHNDQISIFSFSILIHSLSMGLGTSQKTRFSNLFRTNLSLIRIQFRRMFIFMMHPNQKIHTRLQLIKRLLNTPNCELILKCILSEVDLNNGNSGETSFSSQQMNSVNFNSKLAFYLHAMMNNKSSNNMLSNNDKEILLHLDEIFCQVGLNYKTEVTKTLFSLSRSTSNFFTYDSDWITWEDPDQSSQNQISTDFLNQCDKKFDEEILKIYYRTNQAFKHFLQQFERLSEDLNEYAVNLTNQVCSMHSNVRKSYLQRLKNKRKRKFYIFLKDLPAF